MIETGQPLGQLRLCPLLRESDGSGSLEKEYTSTTEQYGDLLSAYDAGGASSSYYEFNAQSSAEALLDDSASVTDRYRYRAFGLAAHMEGSSDNSRTFAGKQGYIADPELARATGEVARATAVREHGLDRFLDEWDRLLEEVTR